MDKQKISQSKYEKAMQIVRAYKSQCEKDIEEIDNEINDKSNVLFWDVHTSVRAYNIVSRNISELGLPEISKIRMFHFRDVSFEKLRTLGMKSADEIQILCKEYGVSLK